MMGRVASVFCKSPRPLICVERELLSLSTSTTVNKCKNQIANTRIAYQLRSMLSL